MPRPSLPRSCLRLAAAALLVVTAAPGGADEMAEPTPPRTRLVFAGTAQVEDITTLGAQTFRLDMTVENPTKAPITIQEGDLLLCHRGGWLVPLDPQSVDGSFFRGAVTVEAGQQRVVAGQKYRTTTPASHVVLAVRAEDGDGQVAVPLVRPKFQPPTGCRPTQPFGVGLVGPLEAVRFSDGKVSVLLLGQHQVLTRHRPEGVTTTATLTAEGRQGEPLAWEGLQAPGDRTALWPFARRLDVFEGFEAGRLELTTRARVGERAVAFERTWPVRLVEPVVIRAPVLGRWLLSNGPGTQEVHDHTVDPHYRYAYDMTVLKQGRTHRGDPHRNASYFAWNRSIRAVADGEVVDLCDRERDNPGYRGSLGTCRNNRVVIKHADGLYTAYLHIRQRSVAQGLHLGGVVRAGQVIARVGNSGDSAEPHLHFMAYRMDETGRFVSAPVAFSNAWHDAKATRGLVGVPVGGQVVHFREPR